MTTTLIVFAIYAVIHVLSYLGKEAAKRKEKERQREAAQRRQMESGRMAPPAIAQSPTNTEPQFGTAPVRGEPLPQPPRRAGKRVDDLASKRREQLDQLRQRREGNRVGSAPVRSAGQPIQPDTPVSAESPRDEMRARQMDMERRRRADAEAKRAKQMRMAQQQHDADAAKARREQARKAAEAQQKPAADEPLTRAQLVQPTAPVASINAMRAPLAAKLRDRSTLRQMFVMRDLLDAPLALRDQAR